MQCEKCAAVIKNGEEREIHGRILCEDCYIDQLTPLKACDPWAVFSAQSAASRQGAESLLPIQREILVLLAEEGPLTPGALAERLQLDVAELERHIAVLRHMEKVRGELQGGGRVVRLWGES